MAAHRGVIGRCTLAADLLGATSPAEIPPLHGSLSATGLSTDSFFVEKVRDILGLFLNLPRQGDGAMRR